MTIFVRISVPTFFNPRWLTLVGSRAYIGQGLPADQKEALKKQTCSGVGALGSGQILGTVKGAE